MLQDLASNFASQELKPFAQEWDKHKEFPEATLRKSAELGFGGLFVDDAFGGTGLSRLDGVVVFEELSQGCTSTAAYISIHNMCARMVDQFASEDVKHRYLEDLCSMAKFSSYCLTEPGSGSDAAALETRAEKQGDEYVLTGSKAFISGGGRSDVYLVMARTGEAGPKGISCFLVDATTPGLSFGAQELKMGWNTQPTATIYFDECRVHARNMVGEPGDGFKLAMTGIDGGRLNIAACSIGAAQACLSLSVEYTKDREQFGQRIYDFQHTQFKLADMATKVHTSRLLVR